MGQKESEKVDRHWQSEESAKILFCLSSVPNIVPDAEQHTRAEGKNTRKETDPAFSGSERMGRRTSGRREREFGLRESYLPTMTLQR